MLSVYDVRQMKEMDARLAAASSLEATIARAGYGIATLAARMLGGAYGKRVSVLAGKGNNGNDGREAARFLRSWGAKVEVYDYPEIDRKRLADAQLVVDAVFGFGFRGDFPGIEVPAGVPLLAVDVPSGLDAGSGQACPATRPADVTLALVGLKVGQLLGDAPRLMGETYLYRLVGGVPEVGTSGRLVEPEDIRISAHAVDTHKWSTGIAVLAGSPGMMGAAAFTCAAALAGGAGIAHLFAEDPSAAGLAMAPLASGTVSVPAGFTGAGWEPEPQLSRYKAVVIGPGRGATAGQELAVLSEHYAGPLVVDADAITAIAAEPRLADLLARRQGATVLTPHGAELSRLAKALGSGTDHGSLARLAARLGVHLLVKGFPTRLYTRSGDFLAIPANGPALASAGTGDVLSGLLAARLAQGGDAEAAISEAVVIHGLAAQLEGTEPVTATRVLERIPDALAALRSFPGRKWSAPFHPVGARGPLYFEGQSRIEWSRR
ncbi:MAG: bifunctional hydroxymethylpyrimidine kinase/phosphomethylpyrimidine kinase [Actinomycetota bacterium]|nr:bifunctional hydroxymethylpyrimidine kinase/phosphomethylpyrimidine kinase [Actinomycetota bacterium]